MEPKKVSKVMITVEYDKGLLPSLDKRFTDCSISCGDTSLWYGTSPKDDIRKFTDEVSLVVSALSTVLLCSGLTAKVIYKTD